MLLRNNARKDSLSVRFHGPYVVLARRGPNVKINTGPKEKWVHLDRCNRYGRETELKDSTPLESTEDRHTDKEDDGGQDASSPEFAELGDQSGVIVAERETVFPSLNETTSLFSELQDEQQVSDDVTTPQDQVEGEGDISSERSNIGRRYPNRIRRPKEYYGDFISWDKITPSMKEKTTLTSKKGNPKT